MPLSTEAALLEQLAWAGAGWGGEAPLRSPLPSVRQRDSLEATDLLYLKNGEWAACQLLWQSAGISCPQDDTPALVWIVWKAGCVPACAAPGGRRRGPPFCKGLLNDCPAPALNLLYSAAQVAGAHMRCVAVRRARLQRLWCACERESDRSAATASGLVQHTAGSPLSMKAWLLGLVVSPSANHCPT